MPIVDLNAIEETNRTGYPPPSTPRPAGTAGSRPPPG